MIQTSGKDSSEELWKKRKFLLLLLEFEFEFEEAVFSSLPTEDVMRSNRREEKETNDERRPWTDEDDEADEVEDVVFFSRRCGSSGFVMLDTIMDAGRGRR